MCYDNLCICKCTLCHVAAGGDIRQYVHARCQWTIFGLCQGIPVHCFKWSTSKTPQPLNKFDGLAPGALGL